MNYWITADTHLNHKKLIEFGRPRGFEEKILSNLSRVLNPDDILIHLGDICIGNEVEAHLQLMSVSTCKKWLVKGNHDRKSDTWYLSHGWDFVSTRICLEKFGTRILFSHIPEDVGDEYECNAWFDVNIHGHFHDSNFRKNEPEIARILTTEHHLLIAQEYRQYMPVNLKKLVQNGYIK